MSSVAALRTPTDQASCTTGKAGEPLCNVTNDNLKPPDCYESMHAFKKIRTSTSGLRKSPNKWTKEENQKLAALVSHYGEKKWKRISAEMGGQKTGAQCAQHWKRVLSPEIRKGHWDENEEDLLLRLVLQYGSCWKKIAKKIPQRTDIQCRYQYLKAKQSREVKWDSKEDESLIKKVMEMANCNAFKIINDNNCNNSTTNFYEPSNSNHTNSPASNPSTDHSNGPIDTLKLAERRLSCSSTSDISDDRSSSGESSGDGWDDKSNTSMQDSGEIRPPAPTSTNSNENVGYNGLAMNKVVWLEIAEHMARMKLTSTLRTALECKTRFVELLGNNIVFPSSSPNGGQEAGDKYFGLKGSGGIGGSGEEKPRPNDTNINININNTSDHNNNNITITNYSRNITINITNNNNLSPLMNPPALTNPLTNHLGSLNTSLTNLANNFNSLGSGAFPSAAMMMKKEGPSNPLDAPRAPHHPSSSLPSPSPPSRAPSFPSFPHHFPPVAQPLAPTAKPARTNAAVSIGGLESLAAVASILPREMLADYAQY